MNQIKTFLFFRISHDNFSVDIWIALVELKITD